MPGSCKWRRRLNLRAPHCRLKDRKICTYGSSYCLHPISSLRGPSTSCSALSPQGIHFFFIICLFHQNFSPLMEARRCSTTSTENLRVALRIKHKQQRPRQKKTGLNPSTKAHTELWSPGCAKNPHNLSQEYHKADETSLSHLGYGWFWKSSFYNRARVVLPWPCWFTRQKSSSWRAGSRSSARNILPWWGDCIDAKRKSNSTADSRDVCVAKQHEVNISPANPVATRFAVKICNIKLVVEGLPCGILPASPASGTSFKWGFSLASHSRRSLMKCSLIEPPWCGFPKNLME